MGFTLRPKVVTKGLILYVDAGNTKSYPGSGTSVVDITKSGNTGTLQGGPTYSSTNGGSLVFDGTNDFMYFTSPSNKFSWTPSGTGIRSLTLDFWVKSADAIGNFISKPWNGSGYYNYRVDTNTLFLQNNTGASLTYSTLSTGNWEHAAVVITPTQMGVYRNGLLNAGFTNHGITGNLPPDLNNMNVNLVAMALYPYTDPWAGDTSHAIAGNLSMLRIYNKALTAEEVKQNFNAMRGRYNV